MANPEPHAGKTYNLIGEYQSGSFIVSSFLFLFEGTVLGVKGTPNVISAPLLCHPAIIFGPAFLLNASFIGHGHLHGHQSLRVL